MESGFRSTDWQQLTFAVVGMGLIGGSYAKALRRLGVKKIIGVDTDGKVLRQAQEQAVIDEALCGAGPGLQAADVVICSVVPKIMYSLTSGIKKYLHCEPMIVGQGTKTGIRIATTNPAEIGADRVVDAVAAYYLYGGPVIVIDYGTATTYDLVTEAGAFIAGVTAPGIRISAKALWSNAAKLPEIEIIKPDSILAKTTTTSMQAGLVYGTIGQAEYIIDKFKEESGFEGIRVVATGDKG